MSGEGGNTHLWEESWDDDDTSEDFSKQLKFVLRFLLHSYVRSIANFYPRQELEKVKGNKS